MGNNNDFSQLNVEKKNTKKNMKNEQNLDKLSF